jgi:hypothetical protein
VNTEAELRTALERRNGPFWSQTGRDHEWRTASGDGTEEAFIRCLPDGFDCRVFKEATGPTGGPEWRLLHGPEMHRAPHEALDWCEARLSPLP